MTGERYTIRGGRRAGGLTATYDDLDSRIGDAVRQVGHGNGAEDEDGRDGVH